MVLQPGSWWRGALQQPVHALECPVNPVRAASSDFNEEAAAVQRLEASEVPKRSGHRRAARGGAGAGGAGTARKILFELSIAVGL